MIESDFYYKVEDVFVQTDRRDYNLLMFVSVETDLHAKLDVAQLVGVFASKAHRRMELY